jgi:hypothetical protein
VPHPEDQGGDKLLRALLDRTQIGFHGALSKYLVLQPDSRFQ